MERTIHSFLEDSASFYPDKIALIHENTQLTYKELNERANKIRNFFIKSSVKEDRIAILLDNSIGFIAFYFGILKAGCTAVILPSNITDDNMIFQIKDCRARYLIYDKKFSDKIERTRVKDIVTVKNSDEKDIFSEKTSERSVSSEDVSTIIYTSGTTSIPKGVKLQHINVFSATKNINEFIKNTKEDIYLSGLPLSHSFGLGHIHVSFLVGGTVIIENNFINLKKVLEDLIKFKATMFAATPATLRAIIINNISLLTKCLNLRMIISNTSPVSRELIEAILTVLPNTDFNYYYGLTEASRSTFINYRKEPDGIGSVGKASPNTKIEIRDGEVCISGMHVVKEYWNNKEASKKIKGGWIHTGDAGYFDDLGYLHIIGRIDDTINVNGEKVMPEEIEEIIKKMPGVSDAAAVGAKDPIFGEVAHLYIVSSNNVEEISLFLKDKVESYKMPKEIYIVNSIPKTDSGKVKRSSLR